MKVNCAYCEKEFKRDANQIKKTKRSFCNRICHGKWKSKNLIGEKNPTYKRIKINCAYCGKELEKTAYQIKTFRNQFCNCSCHDKWRSENVTGKAHPQWNSIKVVCVYCGKEIEKNPYRIKTYKNSFCNSICYHSFRERAKANCAQCGEEIGVSPGKLERNKHQFCNHACYNKWRSKNIIGENNPGWKGGISCEPYCPAWLDKEFKEDIKSRDNHKCQNPDCWGMSDRLGIHHIDFVKKNCHPDNLITLCNSCNSRANTNRDWHTAYYQALMHRNDKINNKLLGAIA